MPFLTMSARFRFDSPPLWFSLLLLLPAALFASKFEPKAVNRLAWLSTSCLISIVIPIWIRIRIQMPSGLADTCSRLGLAQRKFTNFNKKSAQNYCVRSLSKEGATFMSIYPHSSSCISRFLAECQKELTVAEICIQQLTRTGGISRRFK